MKNTLLRNWITFKFASKLPFVQSIELKCFHALHKTLNLVILSYYFAENG